MADWLDVAESFVGRAKAFELYTLILKDSTFISTLEERYQEQLGDDVFSLEDDAREDQPDPQAMAIMDQFGDIGVDEFRTKSLNELSDEFGYDCTGRRPWCFFVRLRSEMGLLPSQIANFNNISAPAPPLDDSEEEKKKFEDALQEYEKECEENKLLKFQPHWHQFVGVAAIVKRFFEGSNVLLADGVGVGKTLQVYMTIAYLRQLHYWKKENDERAVPKFGKWPSALAI